MNWNPHTDADNAQLYTYLTDASTVAPRLLTPVPPQGDVLALNELTVRFSEGVSGIDATDLLVNGVPASGVSSSTNTTYTFTFAQPAYGSVVITWDTNHAIVDFDTPPKPFNGNAASSILRYTLINPSNPRIVSQIPLGGTTVTGLTSVVVTFTEPVAGVETGDFLINGASATGVTSADNTTYTFSFPQPPFGAVAIRWATNHGIVDVEAGNAFDPTRFGGQWNYTLIDPVPSVIITSPTNGTYRLEPADVTLTATANDNDGAVVRVEFFEGSNKVGEATNAPYSVAWTNVQRGAYVLKAVATDNIGLTGTSAPVVLNVVTNLPAFLLRGPYLQVGTPTSGVVRWRTDLATDAVVYYGNDPLNLTNMANETTVTNEHIVQVSGLEPATKYFYSIGSTEQRLAGTNGLDSEYWFNTSPVPGTKKPTRLWVIGDAGTAGNGPPDRQASTRDAFYNYAAATRPADLWLMLGDNAYNSGTDAEHQGAVFNMYPRTLRNLFLWPTIGNHESSQSFTATDFPYLHIFSLPRNGEAGGVPSGTEKYYSFDYANIHFVCLDSMTSGRSTNATMVQWLKDDLTAASAEWLIVFFHHPPYTRGNHNSDNESELIEIRQNILPILESFGVDLVLSGHSHAWERSFLLHGHYGLSGTITPAMKIDGGDGREDGTGAYKKNVNGQGVVYTVAGNAGQVTGGQLNHPAHFLSLNELGSMVIDINSNRLDAIFLTPDGTTHDHFTLIKRAPPVPAAPFGLVALPTSTSEIRLTWSDEATNELGYVIERSLDGVNFAELLNASPDTATLLDSGLLANTLYFYRVRATNAIGPSPWSNLASARTVNATSAPQAPTDLVAASDDGFQFFRSQMILNWHDGSSNEAAFQIERSADGISFVPVATVAANFTSFLDHDLASSTVYFYRVRAVNALGASSASNLAGDETHPQSQLVREGQSAVFHGGVEGEQPLRYQWRFMGAPIPGQTNETLILNNVQFSDAGEYTVAVTNITGEVISNPAFLSVVVPPHIVTQPQDTDVLTGATALFSVVTTGTEPFTYQWRKIGGPIPGANSSSLTLGNVQFGDQAGYDVIVMNDYGATTSRVAALTVFAPPAFTALPELFAEVLRPLIVSNAASDVNVPPLDLVYSLAAGAPTNAHLHPTSGVFRWTPTRAQAPSTNLITVRVADKTRPQLNGSTSFTVYVNDYVEISAGSLVMPAGTNGVVPINVFSSAELTGLECLIQFAANRFDNVSIEELLPTRASVGLEMVGSNMASLRFTAQPGNMLQGTQQVAQLRLSTVAGAPSGFVPLHLTTQAASPVQASLSPTMRANDGRVTIIGNLPLVEANIVNNQRIVTLYGTPGLTYRLEFSTNGMAPGSWRNRASVPLTNFSRAVSIGSQPPPSAPVVFRAVR